MLNILYTLIIFPLVQIMEMCFVAIHRIFSNKAIAIIGVSAAVSLFTMPLYFIAEKWQETEKNTQKKLRPKVDRIKSVFKGDEQYMLLSCYYRQNHYHPVYALRNTFSLLIQIPFFIAAYNYLSTLEILRGSGFLFIRDLGAPDRLLSIGSFSINLLPVIMTIINCAAGAVYAKNFPLKEKVQLYGIAFIFLILLYASPSALVLYWTMNQVFSLLKNVLVKSKNSGKIIYIAACLGVLAIYAYFIPKGLSPKRIFVVGLCSLVFFAPLFIRLYHKVKSIIVSRSTIAKSAAGQGSTYIISSIILFLLAGLVVPGALIASSVQEFSFIEAYTTPLPFMFTVLLQAGGLFLFWPLCVYFLFPKNIQTGLTVFLALAFLLTLIDVFLFPGDYGYLTTTFRFSNPDTFESKFKIIILSAVVTVIILIGFTYLLLSRHKFIFQSLQLIMLISLGFLGIYNIAKINGDFKDYAARRGTDAGISSFEPVHTFSQNGKNVLVIMLDAAISGYLPYIFEEKPELADIYSGFTYFQNCTSFGSHTRIGAPPLFGGYEYEPRYIQKSRSEALAKHNEALLVMPKLFSDLGYRVTVTDPSFANYSFKPDLSIYAPYPEINARNIVGAYSGSWFQEHPDVQIVSISKLMKSHLIRFSILKIAPPAFRIFLYDRGDWLTETGGSKNELAIDTVDQYTTLDYLPRITRVEDSTANTYTAMSNDLTHYPVLFQYPSYVPQVTVTDTGNGPFSKETNYHVNMAAISLLGNWFKQLKDQGIWDNTRILIASDHGRGIFSDFPGNIILPDGDCVESYNSLLLFKDFNARDGFTTDNTFMTIADLPLLATKDLSEEPKNPFTGNTLKSDKANGAFIATSSHLQYTIESGQWMHVKDNIFEAQNWEKTADPRQ